MKQQWPTILVVEDDQLFAKCLKRALLNNDFYADTAFSLGSARVALKEKNYDLVLLDMELPDGSGASLLKSIRRWDPVMPVIVMTVMSELPIRLETFALGSNDFLPKPFYTEELVARIRSHLKVAESIQNPEPAPRRDSVVRLDSESRVLWVRDHSVILRKKLFDLFSILHSNEGQVLTKDQIFSAVWPQKEFDHNTLMVHVAELRESLTRESLSNVTIETIRGVGYRLSIEETC